MPERVFANLWKHSLVLNSFANSYTLEQLTPVIAELDYSAQPAVTCRCLGLVWATAQGALKYSRSLTEWNTGDVCTCTTHMRQNQVGCVFEIVVK